MSITTAGRLPPTGEGPGGAESNVVLVQVIDGGQYHLFSGNGNGNVAPVPVPNVGLAFAFARSDANAATLSASAAAQVGDGSSALLMNAPSDVTINADAHLQFGSSLGTWNGGGGTVSLILTTGSQPDHFRLCWTMQLGSIHRNACNVHQGDGGFRGVVIEDDSRGDGQKTWTSGF